MSLSIQYETVEDASMRLRSTVVLYDNIPHYITGIDPAPAGARDDIFRVRAVPLPYTGAEDEDPIRKYISSKKFDLAPFPMGFCNDEKNGAVYCSRTPARQQKQGLSDKTLVVELLNGKAAFGRGMGWASFIQNQSTADMIAGKYPTLVEAIAKAEKTGKGVAFHRHFAVSPDPELGFLMYLYHKTAKIGALLNGKAAIAPKFKCLKEVLDEAGVQYAIKEA